MREVLANMIASALYQEFYEGSDASELWQRIYRLCDMEEEGNSECAGCYTVSTSSLPGVYDPMDDVNTETETGCDFDVDLEDCIILTGNACSNFEIGLR